MISHWTQAASGRKYGLWEAAFFKRCNPKTGMTPKVCLSATKGVSPSFLKCEYGGHITDPPWHGSDFLAKKWENMGLGLVEGGMSNNHTSLFKAQLTNQLPSEVVPDPPVHVPSQSLCKALAMSLSRQY